MIKKVLLIGTFDSKAAELGYVRDTLLKGQDRFGQVEIHTLDVSFGTTGSDPTATFSIAVPDPCDSREARQALMMQQAPELVRRLFDTHGYSLVCGMGGSNGTALFLASLRCLPVTRPLRVCLSTVAHSASSSPDAVGVTLVPCLCELAGLNPVSRQALECLIGTIIGQLFFAHSTSSSSPRKKLVAVSTFGNTSVAAARIVQQLAAADVDAVLYHAVGSGGRALSEAVEQGLYDGVLDLTTTEMADHLCGGCFSAGPHRLLLTERSPKPIAHLIVPGCLDMVNFPSMDAVPQRFRTSPPRRLLRWNELVTLLRTDVEENRTLARLFSEAASSSPTVRFCIPTKGFSALGLDSFADPDADRAFYDTLESLLPPGFSRFHKFGTHINDPSFVDSIVDLFLQDLTPTISASASSTPTSATPTSIPTCPPRYPLVPPTDDTPRTHALNRLIKSLTANQPIVGAGAGTGISAKFEERGGADLIIIYNSGLFRMAGCGSLAGLLAFSDANKTVLQMAPQVLSVVESVPVIAGINATDPFRQGPSMRHLLTKVKRLGFAGVQNFPTVGLIDGLFRANLEETGMGYQKEVAMIQQAHALGLLTTPYVFDIHQAVQMTTAGADVIVAHMGLTSSGSIGAKTLGFSLQDCAALIQAIADAAWLIRPDVIVLFHGGPIASPEDVRYIFRHTRGLAGFYGASSMERLPVETAITAQVDAFKKIPFWGQ